MPRSKKITNEMTNLYEALPLNERKGTASPDYESTHLELPFRMLIVGSSGSGKTTTALNILSRMPRSFGKVLLCVRSVEEPLYKHMIKNSDSDTLEVFEDGNLPNIDDYKNETQPMLVIFDDQQEEKQNRITPFFIRGRKVGKGISVMYLAQSFYRVPKVIRLQLSHIVLKKVGSTRDLNFILRDCSLGVSKEELFSKYKYATQNFPDFLLIDLSADDAHRFRKNLLEYI